MQSRRSGRNSLKPNKAAMNSNLCGLHEQWNIATEYSWVEVTKVTEIESEACRNAAYDKFSTRSSQFVYIYIFFLNIIYITTKISWFYWGISTQGDFKVSNNIRKENQGMRIDTYYK